MSDIIVKHDKHNSKGELFGYSLTRCFDEGEHSVTWSDYDGLVSVSYSFTRGFSIEGAYDGPNPLWAARNEKKFYEMKVSWQEFCQKLLAAGPFSKLWQEVLEKGASGEFKLEPGSCLPSRMICDSI